MKNGIAKDALINAFFTALYISLIGGFLFYAPRYFSLAGKPDTVFAPIFMLSLFVFSAALTGILVFGKPMMWYLDDKKKESLTLLAYTLAFLFGITLLFFFSLLLIAEPQARNTSSSLANPASVYCVTDMKGKLQIVDEQAGQVGYCSLPDGRVCEEWALMRDASCVPPSTLPAGNQKR